MKALLLFAGFFMTVVIAAQNDSNITNGGLILTDTQKVHSNDQGIQTYTMCTNIDGKDSIISFTLGPSSFHKEEDGEPFIEEYFMVLVFLGLLALFGLYHFLKNKDKKEELAAEEKFVSKYFGEINKTTTEEFYETKVDLYERKIELIINVVSEKKVDHENMERIEDYIDHLVINESKIKRAIQEDYRQNGEVKNYINLFLEDPNNKDFVDSIKTGEEHFTKGEYLLSSLYLLRINFYPEKRDRVFAVFDYTVGEELTNKLLVFIIAKDNKTNITIES